MKLTKKFIACKPDLKYFTWHWNLKMRHLLSDLRYVQESRFSMTTYNQYAIQAFWVELDIYFKPMKSNCFQPRFHLRKVRAIRQLTELRTVSEGRLPAQNVFFLERPVKILFCSFWPKYTWDWISGNVNILGWPWWFIVPLNKIQNV
jgi:hypothetical protein